MPVKCVYSAPGDISISVIVPTWDGERGGNVSRLVEQLKGQDIGPIEIILSIAETPNGHARNLGADAAQGDLLIFIDDDVLLGEDDLLRRLAAPFSENANIGLTGVSQLLPPDAGWFQHWAAGQIPRSTSPVVETLTDSDMVTTMCLAIPRDLFYRIGKMDDYMLAGIDPDLRHRVRVAGYRVAVVPKAWAYHPSPDTLYALIMYAHKKGGYTAWQYRFAREQMYDCPEAHTGNFKSQTTLFYRVMRKILRVLNEALGLKPMGLLYDMCYVVGYLHGLVRKWS